MADSSSRSSRINSISSLDSSRGSVKQKTTLMHQDSLEFFEPLEHPPESLEHPPESISSQPHSLPQLLTESISQNGSPDTQPRSLPPLLTESDSYSGSPEIARRSLPVKRKEKKEKKGFSHMFRRSKKPKEKLVDPGSISIGTFESKQSFSKLKSIRKSSPQLLTSGSVRHRRAKSCDLSNSVSNESEESYDGEGKTLNSEEEFIATLVNPSPRGSFSKSTLSVRPTSSHDYTPHQDSLTIPVENRPDSRLSIASGYSGMESDQPDDHGLYTVQITLHSGHNLAIRDRTGSSDPYVKFKCGRFKYHSSTIHRNLNPEWNESFSFKVTDLSVPLVVRVFDHDYGSLDDFMGGQSIFLESYNTSDVHIVDLGLEDRAASLRGETLGSIRLFLQITPAAIPPQGGSPRESRKSGRSQPKDIQIWKSVVSVILLEGQGLPPMDDNGLSDPYCKFKLGSQKYKSKVIPKTLDPQWKELFELRMYDGSTTLHIEVWDRDFPQSDDFIGSCSVDLSKLEKEVTHNLTLQLRGEGEGSDDESTGRGSIHIHLAISGSSPSETTASGKDLSVVARQYSMLQSVNLKKKKDVGFLKVKIVRAEDLPVLDTFAVVELSNSGRRTQTIYRTANPAWERTFEFDVHDIHHEMEVYIFKENKKLGTVKIPLHRIQSGVCKPYALKSKSCLERAKGVVYIECELVYNPVRAAIRTINPREHKLLEAEEKFSTKVLMNNISRITQLTRTIIATFEFIKSFWSWEDKFKSSAAFFIFLITCLFGELWMFLLAGCFIFGYHYLVVYVRGKHLWQLQRGSSTYSRGLSVTSNDTGFEGFSDFSDLEEEIETTKGRTNIRAKLKQIQEVLLIVQKVLGYIADTEERVRNLFNWSVPFLCWMAICVFLLGSILFYFVPLRYVILVWGINKFSKRLINPNYISNTELVDFISRSPTNKQLEQWRTISIQPSTSKSRGRSPTLSSRQRKTGGKKSNSGSAGKKKR